LGIGFLRQAIERHVDAGLLEFGRHLRLEALEQLDALCVAQQGAAGGIEIRAPVRRASQIFLNGRGIGITRIHLAAERLELGWRDGARVQYRNSTFMDLGEKLVRPDGDDGDGAQGYGFNGTLTFEQVWTTPCTHSFDVAATVNAAPGAMPGDFNYPETLYQAQVDGNLAEITGSIMFNNTNAEAYIDADAVGVFAPANNNLREPANSPIQLIVREEPPIVRGGIGMARVIMLDPRAANDAVQLLPNSGASSGRWVLHPGRACRRL